MSRKLLPRGDSLYQRIDSCFHGMCGLVATLVGDDEDAKIIFRHDVDVALRAGNTAMMRVVEALQAVAADDVPEVADAELGIPI
ncbi:hypothetical protein ABE493_10530 [Stenotrophomonas terrae]|uniref:hypothetical protein n=1 Tax=Stenotrophomonas terrae TaxID=405446 RepID=UPI003208E718